MDEKEHQRLHDQGVPHDHSGQGHHHGHTHGHKQTKAVLNRISRAIGHLERVRQMVEVGRIAQRCCSAGCCPVRADQYRQSDSEGSH